MTRHTLSVLIPAFNEAGTITRVLEAVVGAGLPDGVEREIVVVDDGSSDGTGPAVEAFVAAHPDVRLTLHRHERNRGKGAALHTAIARASGDLLVVQDADLEYDPREIPSMIDLIRNGIADVVFGSRFLSRGPHRVLYYRHYVVNRLLTFLSNILTNLNLTDIEVCYKAFRREVLESIRIEEERFGFEPEITAKVAKGNWRIYEVPISYYGRTYEEGKKIGWRDGVRALYCILRYNLFSRG